MSDIESRMLKQGLIKVPVEEKKEKDSPYKRVAKFLFIIGTEQAAGVLKQLDKAQIDKVVAELVTIRSIDKNEALEILNEFNDIYSKNKNSLGGVDTAKSMLTEAFGSEKAASIIDSVVPEKRPVPFDYLQGMESEALTKILAGELPSAKAIILSQLEAKQAADYISSIQDEAEKKEIILRLAKMEKLDANILFQISEALKKKLVTVNLEKSSKVDGVSVLAEILRTIDFQSGNNILEALEVEDEGLADSVRKKLVSLDDVISMRPKHIQYLISSMTDKDIAVLIHDKDEEFRQAILSNLSKHKAQLVLDEEEYISPIPRKELNDATSYFLSRVKNEAIRGRIIVDSLNFGSVE